MSVDLVARKRVTLTPAQVALIVTLEPAMQACGFRLVCDVCARDHAEINHLQMDNAPADAEWKADCRCTERRHSTTETLPVMQRPYGDLLQMAEEVLRGTGLAIRCPVRMTGCLWTPLTFTAETDGVTARCQCWQVDLQAGRYRFRRHAQSKPS